MKCFPSNQGFTEFLWVLFEEYSVGLNDTTSIVGSQLVPRALKYKQYSYVDVKLLDETPFQLGAVG